MSLSAGDLFFAFLSANLPSAACADSLLIAALPCLVIEGRRFGVSLQAVHVILSSWKSPTVLFPVELLSGAIVCSFCISGTLTPIFFTRNFQLSSVAKAIALALQTAALLDSCRLLGPQGWPRRLHPLPPAPGHGGRYRCGRTS